VEARLAFTLDELASVGEADPADPARRPEDTAVGRRPGPFRRFRASNGWAVWVGRNGRENDRLVREARPWDLWLHARDVPGAHVVLRLPGRGVRAPDEAVLEAAKLAALYSRAAGDAGVDVLVAEAGRVRKPKGASPGRVLVTGERVVRVRPAAPRQEGR
jgi:predicted ribosome quality control (RQC) complex YloA/Tae2 family protein